MLAKMNMHPYRDCFQQVYRMALAAWQSHTFWLQTQHDDPLHEDVLKAYWNFFYATHEAHLTMMIVSLDCLLDSKSKLHNFETLLSLTETHIAPENFSAFCVQLKKLQKSGKSIRIIRNNSFAHVTGKSDRERSSEKHTLPRGDYLKLSYHSMKLATDIGLLLGEDVMAKSPEEIADKDIEDIQRIYSRLESSAQS